MTLIFDRVQQEKLPGESVTFKPSHRAIQRAESGGYVMCTRSLPQASTIDEQQPCHISYSISSTLSCHQPQCLHRAQSPSCPHTVPPPGGPAQGKGSVRWLLVSCQIHQGIPFPSGEIRKGDRESLWLASQLSALPLMSLLGPKTQSPLLVLPIVTLTLDLLYVFSISFQVPKDCEPGKRSSLNFLMNSKEFNLSVLSLRPGNMGCVRNSMVLEKECWI